MRYLFIIFAIFCAATAITLYTLWPKKTLIPEDTIVIINGQPLTRSALLQERSKDRHHGEDAELVNEIISRQLLVGEAQRLGIDREPEFRSALQAFYEHSLIKVLMERVEKDISVTVSDEELQNYLQAFGRIYSFRTVKLPANSQPTPQQLQAGTLLTQRFDDLSTTLQGALSGMKSGDKTTLQQTGNERIVIYLEKIDGEGKPPEHIKPEILKQQLQQAKTEAEINRWMDELRHKASITYTQDRN